MDGYNDLIVNYLKERIYYVPDLINENLRVNNEKLNYRFEFNEIIGFLDDFILGKSQNRFVVLPGIRGVGKTTLLYQIYDYLLKEKNIALNQLLYLSCDELNTIAPCNIHQVIEIFLNKFHDKNFFTLDKKVFIFIDECQYDSNWSLMGKIIYDKSKNIFMIFTGSSALNLEYNADSARRMIKKNIMPLSYTHHLKLKYNIDVQYMSKSLKELLFTGDVNNAQNDEKKVNILLINNLNYKNDDWEFYVKYGAFPSFFNENNINNIFLSLNSIVDKVVDKDMMNIKNFTAENRANAMRILRYLAIQDSGDVSQQKLSNYLKTSAGNVKNILDTLVKTHLIFFCQPYGSSSKRIKKSWKYYFATPSIHNALAAIFGYSQNNLSQFEGVLLENLIGSTLFNLLHNDMIQFSLFYDSNKKSNVDFLIQKGLDEIIPIEVGRGNKDKKQITNAINRYNSEYGIVVSNKTDSIVRDDNVIFMPPKTFSYL